MKLDPASLEKADNDLQRFLRAADGADPVRVVLILGSPESDETRRLHSGADVRPGDFSSTSDYRRALIDRRRSELGDSVGDTMDALRGLSLDLTGGEIGRAIVAEGSAEQIAGALKLNGVSSAILDRPIDLVRPGPGKKV